MKTLSMQCGIMRGMVMKMNIRDDELLHYGVKGMKWGVRRYRNSDGSLTNAGKKRLAEIKEKDSKKTNKDGRIYDNESGSDKFNERMTYFDTNKYRETTTDEALSDRIRKLGVGWEDLPPGGSKQVAAEICRDVIMTRRKPEDRHKYLEWLSAELDQSVYDDPSVMSVDKKTGRMRYNSCVLFDLRNVYKNDGTNKYDTHELDKLLGHEEGSTYYYCQGELQNNEIEHSDKYSEDELLHYGVLGMKWGVRRFQPYTKDQKSGKEVGEAKRKSIRIGWDDDVVIKKGTKAYRISTNKSDTNEGRYLTVDQNDRNFYKGTWPTAMKGSTGIADKKNKIYEQKYKINEDLISPSAAKRQKIAADLTNNPEVQKEITKAWITNSYSRQKGWSIKYTKDCIDWWEASGDKGYLDYEKNIRKDICDDLKKRNELGKAAMTLGSMGSSDRMKAIYGEAIVKRGYNMVIDDHGADYAGNGQRVNAPIIVYNTEKTLKQIGSKKVSDYSSKRALKKYKFDINTIPGFKSQDNYVPNVVKKHYGEDNYYNNSTMEYIY